MGYTKKEQMHETLNKMLDVIQKCISNDLANGKNINHEGIEPDKKVERTFEQINKDEDPQLEAALKY